MLELSTMKVLQLTISLDAFWGGPPSVVLNVNARLRAHFIDTSLVIIGNSLDSFIHNSEIQVILKDFSEKYEKDIYSLSDSNGIIEFIMDDAVSHDGNSSKVYIFTSKKNSPHGKPLFFKEARKLFKIIAESDVVITHQIYNYQNIYLYFFSKVSNTPYILMPHGTLTKYQSRQHRLRKRLVDPLIFNRIIRRAHTIITATDVEKVQVQNRFDSNIVKVGLGFSELVDEVSPKRNKGDRVNFLFMGRIATKKRVDLTLKAFSKILESYPDARLRIAGSGENNLVDLTESLGISKSVEFLGWQSGESKVNAFNNSDYFILNSEDENFAIGVAEAQSMGLPVLVSSFVAFSEIVNEFNSGVVIGNLEIDSIANGMKQIISMDYGLLSDNSRRAARSSSWEVVIKNWITVLEEAASDSKIF
jgi:glycosyltransferase involved in cell wall biosynthesis